MAWRCHDQTYLPLNPEDIWPLISSLEGFKKWYVIEGSRLDPVVGGEFFQKWNEKMQTMCHVAEIVPNERFAFTWAWDTGLEPPEIARIETRIDLWLEPAEDGKGTFLHIEHGDFPDTKIWEGNYFAFQTGWTKFMMCLKCYLLTGVDIRDNWAW